MQPVDRFDAHNAMQVSRVLSLDLARRPES